MIVDAGAPSANRASAAAIAAGSEAQVGINLSRAIKIETKVENGVGTGTVIKV